MQDVTIPYQRALTLAQQHVAKVQQTTDIPLEINESAVVDREHFWVFHYNSAAYWRSGDMLDAIVDTGPVAVNKETGELHQLNTKRTLAEQLRDLQAGG